MAFFYHRVRSKTKLSPRQLLVVGAVVFCLMTLSLNGCGTTKWSDTSRTATEQLLLSHAMDRAVGQLNFSALYGKSTWIDSKAIDAATDSKYFISAVRQHLLANGAKVMDKEEDADYVVELRAGAVGTDRNDLFCGVPSFSVPTGWAADYLQGTTSVPEIAIYRKTSQRAVVKVAVFAYNKKTKAPIWQSGNIQTESRVKAQWIFGTGPFTKGDICEGTELAGAQLNPTITQIIDLEANKTLAPSVTLPVFYAEHKEDGDDNNDKNGESPDNKIPQPTLIPPVSCTETEPDNSGKEDTTETKETMLASGTVNAAASGESGIAFASANATRPQVAMVYPPMYQPATGGINSSASNTYVPNSTTLPWQNTESTNTTSLTPNFGSYYR